MMLPRGRLLPFSAIGLLFHWFLSGGRNVGQRKQAAAMVGV